MCRDEVLSAAGQEFPALEDGKILLFFTDASDLDDRTADRILAWLDPVERARCNRFYFDKDRRTYIASHGMARFVLSKYSHCTEQSLRYELNPYGKPGLKDVPGIQFNLSHSNNVAVLAISLHDRLGVDLEAIDFEKDIHDVVNSYFHEEERAAFDTIATNVGINRFYELWTLKESYIKARGTGLSQPLDTFYFDLGNKPALKVFFDSHMGESADDWHLFLIAPQAFPQTLAAIAAASENSGDSPASLDSYFIDLNYPALTSTVVELIASSA